MSVTKAGFLSGTGLCIFAVELACFLLYFPAYPSSKNPKKGVFLFDLPSYAGKLSGSSLIGGG
jgi:hypothetical protein